MSIERNENEQKANTWHGWGQDLTNNRSDISIFHSSMLAVKELLQGGIVEAGEGGHCLVRVYKNKQDGQMHLLIANEAQKGADIQRMLDYGCSSGETISSTNGAGIKAALSYFSPSEETKGKFIIATKDGDEMKYKKSPYGSYMEMHHEPADKWPKSIGQYTTYIDTVIDNYEDIKDKLSLENLNSCLSVLAGFAIRDNHIHLKIEDENGKSVIVKPDLPYMMPDIEKRFTRKDNPTKDIPEVIANHHQHLSVEKEQMVIDKNGDVIKNEDGTDRTYNAHIDIDIQDACSYEVAKKKEYKNIKEKSDSFWNSQISTQGVWGVMDGVLQFYGGTKTFFGIKEHPSMNGHYTFLNFSSKDGANFIFKERPLFDKSKTSVDIDSPFMKHVKQYFHKVEPERKKRIEQRKEKDNYKCVNSIVASYKWDKDAETEYRKRQYLDGILENIASQYNGLRYITECKDEHGNKYDGCMVKYVSGPHYNELSESEQEKYKNKKLPGEKIELIVEYKKAPLTCADVEQLLRYMTFVQIDNKGVTPKHCILCAPTITNEALDYLKMLSGVGVNLATHISLRLYNDAYNIAPGETECEYNASELKNIISEEEFNKIKSSASEWAQTESPEMLQQDTQVFGSIPISELYKDDIAYYNQFEAEKFSR